MNRVVYFIKPVGMRGPIKIGCSYMPVRRRNALAQWSPFPLEIVAEHSGGFDAEKKFHHHFAQQHEGREWFTATDDLEEMIDRIADGTFDDAVLIDNSFHGWKAPSPQPPWVGEQSALTRAVHYTEYNTGMKCPVKVQDAYKEGREKDIEAARAFVKNPRGTSLE